MLRAAGYPFFGREGGMSNQPDSSHAGGTLFLIPNTLGKRDEADPLPDVIPAGVQQIAARLDYGRRERQDRTRLPEETGRDRAAGTADPADRDPRTERQHARRGPADLLEPIRAGRDGGLLSGGRRTRRGRPRCRPVRLAHAAGVRVRPLVGPSSILLAVMGSGLNGQSFAFNGYLPVDPGERAQKLRELEQHSRKTRQTQVWIETPYRNGALLEPCASIVPAPHCCRSQST